MMNNFYLMSAFALNVKDILGLKTVTLSFVKSVEEQDWVRKMFWILFCVAIYFITILSVVCISYYLLSKLDRALTRVVLSLGWG